MLKKYPSIIVLSILISALIIPAAYGNTNTNFLVNVVRVNGTPIQDASVTITLQEDTNYQRSGSSNSRGEVFFENIREGVYKVNISKSGFASITKDVDISQIESEKFYLRSSGFKIISGHVYRDLNNDNNIDFGELGISNATVTATGVTSNQSFSTATDENGQFRIEVPDGENYTVKASYSTSEYQLPTSVVPTDTIDYSINIPLVIKGDVIGKVTTEDDAPLFGVLVFLKGTTVSYTSTDLGGFFRFSVKPGEYFLEVEFRDYEKYTSETFKLEEEEQKEYTIVLSKRKGILTYEIKTEDGKTLSEVDAEIIRTGTGDLVEKINKPSGTVSLIPGVYTLIADARGYDPSEVIFEITEDGISKSITLDQADGSIKVSLRDPRGNPISGVSILVDGVQKGTSDDSGVIVISDLPPKQYEVTASSTLHGKVTQLVTVEGETEKEINLVLESNILTQALPFIVIAGFIVIIFLLKKNLKYGELTKKPLGKQSTQDTPVQDNVSNAEESKDFSEPKPIKKSKLKTKKPLRGLPKRPSKNMEE